MNFANLELRLPGLSELFDPFSPDKVMDALTGPEPDRCSVEEERLLGRASSKAGVAIVPTALSHGVIVHSL